jgi:hypothetical protein
VVANNPHWQRTVRAYVEENGSEKNCEKPIFLGFMSFLVRNALKKYENLAFLAKEI